MDLDVHPSVVSQSRSGERILEQFKKKWDDQEAERRTALLEEIVPRIPEYAKLNNARVDIKVHPEHLEFYISQLQPKVRAIVEHVPISVMNKILDSHTTDERIAKVVRIVNMMDEKALAQKAERESDENL